MNERERIGKRIAQLREEKRLTQRDLANLIGITQSNIWKIENGKYSVGLDILSKISAVLGKRVDLVDIPEDDK